MVETTDHAQLGQEQMGLLPPVFVPPKPESAKRKKRGKKNRKQKTLTGLFSKSPKPKRVSEPPAVQITFGVVVITNKDRQRWKRESLSRRRRRCLKEVTGNSMELIEWHMGLLDRSLEELKETMGCTSPVSTELRKEILSWMAEPIETDLANARLFSFQACAFLSGMDPETMEKYQQKAKEYESAYQKEV